MNPRDYIAQHGIGYFQANKGKQITIRLLSDDNLVYSGHFVGITPAGDYLPLVNGMVVELPQFNIHFLYRSPNDKGIVPISVNLLLVDSIDDISFSE